MSPCPSYRFVCRLAYRLPPPPPFSVTKFSLSLSSVLTGHDTWVTSVHFSPLPHPNSSRPLQLLSSSADNSLILWSPTAADSSSAPKNHLTLSSQGIFFALHRFGQISMKGLGFFGALWGRDGREVLASGWAGGWNVWTQAKEGGEDAKWEERSGPTGHFEQVKAAAWGGREGREWLLSVRCAPFLCETAFGTSTHTSSHVT